MTVPGAVSRAGIRRALLIASAERYLILLLNFVVMAIVSRLLTPAEIGFAVLGMSLLSVAETLREFGIAGYLTQEQEVGRERVRTAFTVMLLASVGLAGGLVLLSGPLAAQYRNPSLTTYLQLVALGILMGPFAAPGLALLRRDMAFGRLAAINLASSVASAVTTLGLVLAGFSAMSFAWGGIAWATASAAATIWFRPDFWMFRPLLSDWRSMLAFAGLNSAIAIMNRLYEVLPYLVLGRVLSTDSVGLYNRAVMTCQLPDKLVLLGLGPVALPVFAAEARAGHDLAAPYLRASAYISAVQWPALVLTALLAHPLVMLLLGPQWLASVSLVRILTLAATAFFLAPLTYPVLVAVGAIRHVLASCLLSLPISAAILIAAAHFGLEAMAWSALLTTPFQTGVALYFVRCHLRFGWNDFGRMVVKSLGVTILTAIAPVTVILAGDAGLAVPLGQAALAGLGAAACWAAALFLLRHPFAEEVWHLASALLRRLSETRAIRRLGNRPKPS